MFLHAVDTGLQDEAIRNRFRPSLKIPGVQDVGLIQQMNVIVSEDTERKSKLGTPTRHKSTKINEMRVPQAEGAAQPEMTDREVKVPDKDIVKEDRFVVE